jgi:hypothetical protein
MAFLAALGLGQCTRPATDVGEPSPAITAPARGEPLAASGRVVVTCEPVQAVFTVDQPIALRLRIHNHQTHPIEFHGFGGEPTGWNAETASVALLDIQRDGAPHSLYRERPAVDPPRGVAGPSRRVIAPDEEWVLTVDARKWTIDGGWRPGAYRLTARIDGLRLNERTTASVTSEPVEFRVQ